MSDWAQRCRQCGRTPVRNRAWCPRCLRRVSLGLPTDLDDIPTATQCEQVTTGSADKPFPFWPSKP